METTHTHEHCVVLAKNASQTILNTLCVHRTVGARACGRAGGDLAALLSARRAPWLEQAPVPPRVDRSQGERTICDCLRPSCPAWLGHTARPCAPLTVTPHTPHSTQHRAEPPSPPPGRGTLVRDEHSLSVLFYRYRLLSLPTDATDADIKRACVPRSPPPAALCCVARAPRRGRLGLLACPPSATKAPKTGLLE